MPSKGAQENRRKRRVRTDLVYQRPARPLDVNDQEFRFKAIRPGIGNFPLDSLVETVEWRDEGTEDNLNTIPILRGSMTLRRPDEGDVGNRLTLRNGHSIECEVRWYGEWRPLWRMRILEATLNIDDGAWQLELADDLHLLSLTPVDVRFRKGKKRRRRGWRYHEIVRHLARRYRIPLGQIVRGTRWITNFDPAEVPLLEVIRQAVEEEREWTGRRYVMRWAPTAGGGYGLHILPWQRNEILYEFSDLVLGAMLKEGRRGTLASAILATGHTKEAKGRKRKKFKVRVVSEKAVQRWGYIEQRVTYKGAVQSEADLRKKALRSLERRSKPVLTLESFRHPGVAYVRRGDAIEVELPDAYPGFTGKRGIMFVISARHTVSGGTYDMDLSLSLTDPFDPKKRRAELDKAARRRKRAAKGKTKARS